MDWRSKLTSRKFWMAVASFVSLIVIALGGTNDTAAQVTAIVMAGATVVAYIVGEGLVDAAAIERRTITDGSTTETANKV